MKNYLENKIKENLSACSPEIPEPEFRCKDEAHRLILTRKRKTALKSSFSLFTFFVPRFGLYHSVLAIIAIVFILLNHPVKYTQDGLAVDIINQNRSASSSTVLAGLTSSQENASSVQSSTVLTSIITFASKN